MPKNKALPFPDRFLPDLLNARNPFSLLTASEASELLASGELQAFRTGSCLFRAGDRVKGIYCLVEGAVKISQLRRERAYTLRFAARGDWVGHRSIFTRTTYLGSAIAREPTLGFFVPSDLLLRFFGSNTGFASHFIRQISHDLELTEKKLLDYQEMNVPSRMISLFRGLDEKFGCPSDDGRALQIRLTKVEISEMIGASQEVVVRQLSKWKKESLIREEKKRFLLSKRLLERITLDR